MTTYRVIPYPHPRYFDAWVYHESLFACRKQTLHLLDCVGRTLNSEDAVIFEIRRATQEEIDGQYPNVFRVEVDGENLKLCVINIPNAGVKYSDMYGRMERAIAAELDAEDVEFGSKDFVTLVDEVHIWIDVHKE